MHDIANLLCYLVLIIMAVFDIRAQHIPNALILLLIAFGFFGICVKAESLLYALLSMLIVGLPLLAFAVHTKDNLGGGDVKMCAATAFCFGAQPVLWVLCMTTLLMIGVSKLFHKKSLPMAPYFTLCSIYLLII